MLNHHERKTDKMSKVAVVFWSSSGNTETMANAVLEGAKNAGAEAELFEASAFDAGKISGFDALAFGCPAMGDEVLEEDEFQPLWDSCKQALTSKKVALFGSYGWGDGEWMRSWEADAKDTGISLFCDSVICNETPDEGGLDDCRNMGRALAQ